MIALDTNLLLRLLAHDDAGQLAAIERFFKLHADETFFVPDIVLVEAVWTLRSAFRWDSARTTAALRQLAAKPDVEFEARDRVAAALKALAAGGDFADELIVGSGRGHDCTGLGTFDAGLAARHRGFAVQPK